MIFDSSELTSDSAADLRGCDEPRDASGKPIESIAPSSEAKERVDCVPSDAVAIAQAQASIDRWLAGSAGGDVDVDTVDLEQLAAALDMLGTLGAGALTASQMPAEQPIALGRFQVFGERGRGGFGIVLRAFDPLLQREVALKLPRPERLMAGQSPNDFVREAQIAARLEHPGIVRVYEAQRLGPVWYIASAYCAGPTLAEWFNELQSPLPPRIAAGILAEIADAVHYAHSRGVLHLDLKPENILLDSSDNDTDLIRPLVTDFGLSGRSDEIADRSSRIAGTLAYMAPEQRTGDSSQIGIAADVYALGAILYELLNGPRDRQQAGSSDRTASSNQASLAPLAPVRSTTPRDLNAVCRKCLQDAPDERYGSVHELAVDLRSFLRGEAVTVRTANWPEGFIRWMRRRPAVAALIALLAVTTLASLGTITQLWRRAEANLAQLHAEEEIHSQTADRMRSSLLNLTWLMQEKRLLHGQPGAQSTTELKLLRDFYRDVRDWSNAAPDKLAIDAALRAASHSIALIDGLTPHGHSRVVDEFTAGVAAWQGVIDQQPTEPRWRRALALHFFTYAARTQPPQWLWWRNVNDGGAAITPTVAAIVEEPYAMLLVEFASQHTRFYSKESEYAMLCAASSILEESRDKPDPGSVRNRTLLAAYNQLAEAARLLSRPDQSRDALSKAEILAAAAPPAAECQPEFALAVGNMHNIRSRVLARERDWHGALAALASATPYLERGLAAFPNETSARISYARVLKRIAELNARLRASESMVVNQYRATVAVLDEGIARAPDHRTLTQFRAAVGWELARYLLASGDKVAAQVSLEAAVRDYTAIGLCNQDSHALWMQAIRSWQTLGRLYAEQGRTADAITAFERSLTLLEGVKPRRGTTSQFAEYSALSRGALTALLPSTTGSRDKP